MVHGALYMVYGAWCIVYIWCVVRKWENPLSIPMSSFWRSVSSLIFNFNFLKKYFHFFIPMVQVGESSLQGQRFDLWRSASFFIFKFCFCFLFSVPMYKAQVGEASLQAIQGQTFDARRRRPLDNTWEQVSNCLQQATQHWLQYLL